MEKGENQNKKKEDTDMQIEEVMVKRYSEKCLDCGKTIKGTSELQLRSTLRAHKAFCQGKK